MEELHWSLKSFSFKFLWPFHCMAIQHLIRVLAINMVWLSRRNRRGICAISTIHRKHKIQIRAILRGHYRRAQQFNAKQNKYKHETQNTKKHIHNNQSTISEVPAQYQHNSANVIGVQPVWHCDTVPVPVWHCACSCMTLCLCLCDTETALKCAVTNTNCALFQIEHNILPSV